MPRKTRTPGAPDLVLAARENRREPTSAEQTLWQALRKKTLGGFRFRRQVVFGPYILDFYCLSSALALEIDGLWHEAEEQKLYDNTRTQYLNNHNITVLRFSNHQVEQDLEGVLSTIQNWLETHHRN